MSPQLAAYLLNYSLDLHLYLFGVACHLLLCFTYILWVNCWMNWISWSWNYIMPSGSFMLGLGSEIFWSLTITILVIQAIHEWLVEGRELSHAKYTILEFFCDCEPPSKYYMPKLLTLDKEDNVMIYVCSYSHRSYIVIGPSTCGACPHLC